MLIAMKNHPARPRDPNQLGKLVVDLSVEEWESNSNLERLKHWVKEKVAQGFYEDRSARLRLTAINLLQSVMKRTEPQDFSWIWEHLDMLWERYSQTKKINSQSLQTYAARVKSTLRHFLKETMPLLSENEEQIPLFKEGMPDANKPSPFAMQRLQEEFSKKEVVLFLPASGINSHFAYKIAFSLLTQAKDFVPTDSVFLELVKTLNKSLEKKIR